MSSGEGRTVDVNGISLHVEEFEKGTPVLLLHGWPDSSYVWRNQIPFLTRHGFRTIVPDMRGFGQSSRPAEVAEYALSKSVGDVTGLLDAVGLESAHVVGHDWGAAVAWSMAMAHPDRVAKLVVLSVGHPGVPKSLRQDEMAWYQLFFQFEGIAEANLAYDDWAWLRRFLRGAGDQERYEQDLSRPGALTASLNWYRANLAPKIPGPSPELPPVLVPTLGIWSTNDHYLDGERMQKSGEYVKGPWRYEEIEGASHWIPLEAPDLLNSLLLEWLQGAEPATSL
jgi:pimeloyl-ACP methyl ester carboxylesterase